MGNRLVASDRVDWVDYAKGICIVLVVMMHSVIGVDVRLPEGTDTGFMGWIVAFAAPFRMPDFFLLSGLFLSLTIDRPWGRYFDRKVVHFAYFYVLWLTIQFAFKGVPIALEDGPGAALAAWAAGFVVPFGTLWFIYMLPVFFLVCRLLHRWNVPHVAVLLVAAGLQAAPIHTGVLLVDEFASRFVWFYAGYALAPQVFALAAWIGAHRAAAFAGLASWGLLNGALVWVGLAHLPVVSLVLGGLGACAVVAFGVLACAAGRSFDRMRWLASSLRWLTSSLRWLGSHSIVVYLAFFLPMIVAREVSMRFVPVDASVIALLVTVAAVVGPVVFYGFVRWTGWGRFLFERPAWATLEGRAPVPKQPALG